MRHARLSFVMLFTDEKVSLLGGKDRDQTQLAKVTNRVQMIARD
jgi:hypothetical protein